MKKSYFILLIVCFLLTSGHVVAQTHFFDDVEEQVDFAVTDFVGWQTFDYDGNPTDGMFHDFPNKGGRFAFIVMNPSMTNPVNTFDFWQPYSGNKYFASLNKTENYVALPTDSWLVSPELDAPNGGVFDFQARSPNTDYNPAVQFKVGYSSTTTDKEAFTFFATESQKQNPWRYYSYEIPAGAKYVAVVTVDISGSKSGLCLDDLRFTADIKEVAPSMVSDIAFVPDPTGGKEVVISWVNPLYTINGIDLTALTSVQIYRGKSRMTMELIATVTDYLQPGANAQYTDATLPEYGMYYYAIIPVNEAGKGNYWFSNVYIGKEDVPGAPHYILFEPNAQYENLIKWNEVNYGEMGGLLNGAVTGYTLTRKLGSDAETLVDNALVTSYLETPAPALNLYNYSIFAQVGEDYVGAPYTENKYSGLEEGQAGIGLEYKTEEGMILNFEYESHISQSIYDSSLFENAGVITSLDWFGDLELWGSDNPVALKVYMSTTNRNNFGLEEDTEVWIYFGDQSLVYEGTMLPGLDGETSGITFDKGFYYDPVEEENLVITVIRPMVEAYSEDYYGNFYASVTDSLRTYFASGYTSDVSIITSQLPMWQSKLSFLVPNIVYTTNDDYGKVSFKIDAEGSPVGNVMVEITPKATSGTTSYYKGATDEVNGEINNVFLLSGEYEISIFKEGYVPETFDFEMTKDLDKLFEITLSDVFPATLYGAVHTSGAAPIAGALVKFSGYSSAETTTNAYGEFEVVVFQGQSYNLEITHPLYQTHTQSFTSEEEDEIQWEPIVLSLAHHPVYDVTSDLDKETSVSEITWESPIGLSDSSWLQWGSGIKGTSWGAGGPEFTAAVRFDVDDLSDYQGGDYYLTEYRINAGNYSDISLEVYEAAPNGEPQLIHAQQERVDGDAWYNFQLDRPVAVNPGKEIYLAVRFYVGYGAYPAGIDDGPGIAGKGNYINEGEGWRTISLTNKNWCIYATIAKISETSPTSYTISRGAKEAGSNPNSWPVLKENHTELNYTDNMSGLAPSTYRYAVKALYPDGAYSDWSLSNSIDFLLDFNIDVTIQNLDNAFVALYGQGDNEDAYYDAAITDGEYLFEEVKRGAYKVKIWADNYDTYLGEEFELTANKELNINMDEYLCPPSSLQAEWNVNGDIELTWDLAGDFLEGFETYPDFEKNSIGDYILVDNDGITTYTFMHFTFPDEGIPMSYFIFNPYATEPPVEDALPYDGRRYLANFGEEGGFADDWIIIPAREGAFSFYVRSIVSILLDEFTVWYSTTGTALGDFIRLHDEEYLYAPVEWTRFEYLAPEGTKYIAIQNVTYDGYIMLFDNLLYQKPYNHAIGYDIYLDNTKVVSDVTDKAYTLTEIPEVLYQTISVVAKYAGGDSEKTTIAFPSVGIDDIATSKMTAYPNPTHDYVYIKNGKGALSEITVYDLQGILLIRTQGDKVDLSGLAVGMYIIDVDGTKVKILKE